MRILHVATLVTPDGAYGGPIRVAENQLRALAELGHEVELVAGHSGFDTVPTNIGGVPASLFPVSRIVPKTGFAGLMSSKLLAHVKRRLPEVDVVHVHVARDLVTLPAARAAIRSGVPVVLQPHGMIDESSNPLAAPLDAALTRSVLAKSGRILTLTELEAESLTKVARTSLALERIPNGVPLDSLPETTDDSNEVLFLARLHSRKRPTFFVDMAQRLIREGSDASFVLVGPDEGEGSAVAKMIAESGLGDRIRWEGSLPPGETLRRIARCAIYVLPSINEIIPMSVLEAMSLARPSVITVSNGLAEPLAQASAGKVVDESIESLTDAVRTLLADPALRANMGANAQRLATERFSMSAVAAQLEQIYGSLSARQARASRR